MARQFRSEPHGAVLFSGSLEHTERQSDKNTRPREASRTICSYFSMPRTPVNAVDLDTKLYRNAGIDELFSKDFDQIRVSMLRSKSTISFDSFLSAHSLYQPMHAEERIEGDRAFRA